MRSDVDAAGVGDQAPGHQSAHQIGVPLIDRSQIGK